MEFNKKYKLKHLGETTWRYQDMLGGTHLESNSVENNQTVLVDTKLNEST